MNSFRKISPKLLELCQKNQGHGDSMACNSGWAVLGTLALSHGVIEHCRSTLKFSK